MGFFVLFSPEQSSGLNLRTWRRRLVATGLAILAAATLHAEENSLASRIDPLFSSVRADTPGAAVLVARDGKVLLAQGYGAADLEAGKPVTPATRFRIGSISKVFTAAAILKLQEQGKLRVNDPLSRYLPDWPNGESITLYHLLSHSSGIHNYTAKPDFLARVAAPIPSGELLESFRRDPADFSPGTGFLYGNSGYALLAAVIEKVSGLSYEAFLRASFFLPLGMADTGVYPREGSLENEAVGYGFRDGSIRLAVKWHRDRLVGCGALYSTTRDLFRWNEALFSGQVLSENTLRAAFTVSVLDRDDPMHPEETGQGLGWFVDKLRGEREVGHGGEMAGFGSYLLRLPEKRLTVVVLLNCMPQRPGLQQWSLAREIAVRTLGAELPPSTEPQVDATVTTEDLERVVGRYHLGAGQILTITREERRVYMEISGRKKTEIFPRTDRIFFVNAGEAEASFVRDPEGRVVKAILKQAGKRIDAPRL